MGKRILIVEDDAALQEGMVSMFTALGCDVLAVSAIEDAARVFSENYPSPGIDGIVWDGNLLDDDSYAGDGPGKIRWVLAQGFKGPMLACSVEHKAEQRDAGCTHSARKSEACDVLSGILGIS